MKGVVAETPRKQRIIRVFVSSTFRDMKEEREELMKRVFPRLRKMCEARGVVWGEVDLRWGITDEERAEGKVLPICLREIDECRPYFICVLGERYGWVPSEIPEELIEQEPWLAEHREKSVTELEILHGVLNNPDMADQAFFYFRDPSHVYSMPIEMRGDFVEAPTPEDIERLGEVEAKRRAGGRRERLIDLKNRIRGSGLPVREGFRDPKRLADLVLEDLTGTVDRLFPEGEQPGPLDREAMQHEAFAQAKCLVYIGRKEYFDRLEEHARGEGPPLVVLGESGSGKSALLANWAVKYRDEHPDELVITHFIGSTPYSSDWAAMLRRIMGEFKRRFGIQEDIPTKSDKLSQSFANWLHMASARIGDGRVVVILDALNQLEDRDGAPDLVWLPPMIPEKVRVIVSTLPGRPLSDLRRRGWPTMKVEPLNDEERRRLVRDYLAQYRKGLSSDRCDRIAASEQTHNPLFLRALVDELRLFGVHQHLDRAIEHYLASKTIPELYERILKRLEQDYDREWPGLVQDSMTSLWASRRGLSEAELLDLVGVGGEPMPHGQWAQFHSAAAMLLTSRSGLIGFAHDYVREAIENKYVASCERKLAAHLRLADYFLEVKAVPRMVDELPWQLSEAQAWERLYRLLADLEFFGAVWEENQCDVKRYWARVESSSSLRSLEAYRHVLDSPETAADADTILHLSDLLDDSGHIVEAVSLREFLIKFYGEADDLRRLGVCLGKQAKALYGRGEFEKAMALAKRHEQICSDAGELDGVQESLGNQAMTLFFRGDLDEAMALLKEQEGICREIGDDVGLARSLHNQARVLFSRGDLEAAMVSFREGERNSRERGDLTGLIRSLSGQAVIRHQLGHLDRAQGIAEEQERISRELGDPRGLYSSLGIQALIAADRGDLDRSMALRREEEAIHRQLGNLHGLAYCLNNQAYILQLKGDLERAMEIASEEERISRNLGDPSLIQNSLFRKGQILYCRGDSEDAIALLREQERICREIGLPERLAACLNFQGAALVDCHDLDGALAARREQERICRELGLQEGLALSLAHQGDILAKKGHLEDGLALAEEAHKLASEYGYELVMERDIGPILENIRAQMQ